MNQPSSETQTLLEQLHSDRARVTGELAALSASSAKLSDAANAEAAVLQEIGELGSVEIAAMTAWASAGCVAADQPVPDQKQRRALSEKLAAAQSASAAAKGACKDIEDQISELQTQLSEIASTIDTAALDAAQAEFLDLVREHSIAIEHCQKLTALLAGFCNHLSTEGRNRTDRGDAIGGLSYLKRLQALPAKFPVPSISHPEVNEASNNWGIRVAVLRKGAA